MLSVEGLKVRYGQIEAVKGIDFSVAQGEIVTLLGANGAGKTSTLAAIVGMAPATGVIRFESNNIVGLRPEDISKRGIALTPEGRRVFPALTVAENLLLGGAMHHKGASLDATREEMLALFPILRERYRQRAGLLSGGEQQMLAIARSLMSQPRLLLLDEPSLGLAPKIVDEVFRLIAGLRGKGITILLVEQNAVRALAIADRGYVLVNGRITLQGKGRDLAQSDEVRAAYLAA
ncbi:ABC transporter ATP-binding protein [Nordella sp. HKS 07]|uniref:ABC transporter ATP-binding protein n=1 Tax=Nordella sp. HKS 07 TaxID=2712222 RepID=UPI0013E1B3AC|nr:ABC transporter ATP-binding protein [Nordella sp. HKS 07]QIG49710.1 ABC transporter ATP-binding protein [Nordella sp. HKS 07]